MNICKNSPAQSARFNCYLVFRSPSPRPVRVSIHTPNVRKWADQ